MVKPKPSSREKKRYVVFALASKETFSYEVVKHALQKNLLRYIGEFGYEKAQLYVIKNTYSPQQKKGILRVTNKSLSQVKESFSMLKDIQGKKASLNILGISGILKKAKYKFLTNKQKK